MNEITTRTPRPKDISVLKNIWKTVFGDGDEKLFFKLLFDPSLCVAALQDDLPVAAGYLLPAGRLICGSQSAPCAMIYALATHPESRGMGFGAAVVRALISLGHESGYSAVVLCPSEDSLYEYYSARSDLHDWFYASERIFERAPGTDIQTELSEITPYEYYDLRESLLAGVPHIGLSKRLLTFQRNICNKCGGGLFKASAPFGISCFTVEKQMDGAVWIKELLTADSGNHAVDEACVISSVASAFHTDSYYLVRTPTNCIPVKSDASAQDDALHELCGRAGSYARRFGMLSARQGLFYDEVTGAPAPWYGLAFD